MVPELIEKNRVLKVSSCISTWNDYMSTDSLSDGHWCNTGDCDQLAGYKNETPKSVVIQCSRWSYWYYVSTRLWYSSLVKTAIQSSAGESSTTLMLVKYDHEDESVRTKNNQFKLVSKLLIVFLVFVNMADVTISHTLAKLKYSWFFKVPTTVAVFITPTISVRSVLNKLVNDNPDRKTDRKNQMTPNHTNRFQQFTSTKMTRTCKHAKNTVPWSVKTSVDWT